MACPGTCTFESSLRYSVLNGQVSSFEWSSGHSATGDCSANIGNGAGWFRFQRVTGRAERITRQRINNADPAMGGTGNLGQPQPNGSRILTGGGLPAGVGVTVAAGGDYTGIQIGAPAGGANPQLLTIDINVALETSCSCRGNTRRDELHVRFLYDLNQPAASQVRHNGTRQAGAAPPPGQARTITMRWSKPDVCNSSATSMPQTALLTQWEFLTGLANPTAAEQQALQNLEGRLNRQDGSLTQDQVASAQQHLWWGDGSSALAAAAGDLFEAYRSGKLDGLEDLQRQLEGLYEPEPEPEPGKGPGSKT